MAYRIQTRIVKYPSREILSRMWMSKDVLFRLEPYDGKLSSTVLRGASSLVTDLWAGNGPRLLDPAGFVW